MAAPCRATAHCPRSHSCSTGSTPSDTAHLAEVLDPLRGDDGLHGELTRTLRVYLAEHGSWGVAAEQLGVHRQTLTNRIHRVEELTGLSMGNPDDRTAAWLAIRALDR